MDAHLCSLASLQIRSSKHFDIFRKRWDSLFEKSFCNINFYPNHIQDQKIAPSCVRKKMPCGRRHRRGGGCCAREKRSMRRMITYCGVSNASWSPPSRANSLFCDWVGPWERGRARNLVVLSTRYNPKSISGPGRTVCHLASRFCSPGFVDITL
jgi:hypothetical protein